MRRELLALDPASYTPHALHGENRQWRETNCSVDYVVELVHSLGGDPVAGLGFCLSGGFDGEQWRMLKYPAEDLRELYGIDVYELNLWRAVDEHVGEQLSMGRVVALDVDAFYLPDTAGTTYKTTHHKTSAVVQMIDPAERRAGYFHNAGYFELERDDYDGVFGTAGGSTPARLPPYAEVIRLDAAVVARPVDVAAVRKVAAAHLERRPRTNQVRLLGKRIGEDLDWIAAHDVESFHRYAFGTLRQFGANAELAASFASWVAARLDPWAAVAESLFDDASGHAKTLQFSLARVARGRSCDLDGPIEQAADAYEKALTIMGDCLGD